MALTSLTIGKPGGKFSKLVLSMHNFFYNVETSAAANRAYVLHRIAHAKMFIGVVCDPEFREEDGHYDCIWSLAEGLDAVVFNGEAILNPQGERLLAQSGETDVTCDGPAG